MADAEIRGTVLLLKAPKDTGEDPFVVMLKQAGYRVVLVPVLSFNFVNQEILASALSNADKYSGIIFTSVRAVQAVDKALPKLRNADAHTSPHHLRCFVVGHTTASAAKEAHFQPQGADTGNAEKLADFILDAMDKGEKRPLLYPCAQLRRDTLLDRLQSSDCNIEEVIAYETVPSEAIQKDVTCAFSSEDPPDSVVYFSPSGVQFTESLVEEGVLPLKSLMVYALGPATEQALVSRHFPVAGVAAKPDPDSLLQLLLKK
ncbi:uroporphyrinogen-III synthase-like isoform X2 [Babylonia areolata]